ncbi:ATP-dependent rRNA helicase spb-4 [Thozetella sp. PMI_491]|nr:ATP-dependent rRNA helicase spb-4 [Thozetella sp. PMI_491]
MAPKPTAKTRSWDLTPPLADFILDYLASENFTKPTPVQQACLELFRGNKDVVVEAVTGSGKSLAMIIPLVEKCLRERAKKHHVQAIIIAPTRELAAQLHSVLLTLIRFHEPSNDLLSYLDSDEKRPESTDPVLIPQLLVGGGTKATEDLGAFLRLSPNILVATPGRLAELLTSPYVKTPSSAFECLVLDEADRLLDMGFSRELEKILQVLPKQRRTGLFSASVTDAVSEIIKVGLTYPHRIVVRVKSSRDGKVVSERKTPMSLQMNYIVTKAQEKIPALCQLLIKLEQSPQRVIVFLPTCHATQYWTRVFPGVLPQGRFSVIGLHGQMPQKQRNASLTKFINSVSPTILLTTDVASRGLDIPQVDLVVQLEPPQDAKTFIHRCGRAGRAGRKGLAVLMLLPGTEAEGYPSLLDVRQTPISPLVSPTISVTEKEAAESAQKIRTQALADREIFQLAQRGFVSFVRSHMQYQETSIFRPFGRDDWLDLAQGWGLLELPKMFHELKGLDIDRSLGLGLDIEAIAFKDKVREKKRQNELAVWKAEKAARADEDPEVRARERALKKRRNEAWSDKQDREEVRVVRRDKKRRRKEAEMVGKMTEDEKSEQRKLVDMIAEIRSQNQAAQQAQAKNSQGEDDDEFHGFDD